MRFHDLRHTCATLLFARGVHPKLVQELLGHSAVGITLDTYSHVIPGMGDVAADAIEEALSEDDADGDGAMECPDTMTRNVRGVGND